MIRLVTLDAYDPKVIDRLCKVLYTAFGVGCEHAGDMALPAGQSEPFDAHALVEALPAPRAYADDKILYLTSRKLKPRSLISGDVPSSGFANQNGPRALVSSAGVKDPEAKLKLSRGTRCTSSGTLGAAPLPRPALRDVPALDAQLRRRRHLLLHLLPRQERAEDSALPSPERRPSRTGPGTRVRLDSGERAAGRRLH